MLQNRLTSEPPFVRVLKLEPSQHHHTSEGSFVFKI